MTYLRSGKAVRLPLLGNAIVGAVMLLRGDAAQGPQPVPEIEAAPDLARFSVVLDLPEPEFARTAPSTVTIGAGADVRTRMAAPASDATNAAASAASLTAPVVSLTAIAGPPGGMSVPVTTPSPARVAAAETAPIAGRAEPVLSAPGSIEPSRPSAASPFEVGALLGEALAPLEARVGLIGTDPFPVPAFGQPVIVASEESVPPQSAPTVSLAQSGPAAPEPVPVVEADHAQGLAEAPPPPAAASSPSPGPRLALAMPMQAPEPSKPTVQPDHQAPSAAPVAAKAFPESEAPFPPGAQPSFSYDDELILQVETAKREMSDTMIAYGTRSGVYIPFGALTRFLDLSIAVSDDGHFASGWFLSADRTITINLREGKMILSGKETALERGEAIAFDGELYLRAEHFAKIFPLRLNTNLRAQVLHIETLEEFPYAQRLARERARELLEGRKGGGQARQWPREETPWRAFSAPMTDIELRAASGSSLGTRLEGDLRIGGDLAFMTARAYLSGSTRDGLTGARIELGRKDPDGRLFGPVRATEFQIGDVATQALPLGLRGIGGRGAAITNAPIDRASLFDAIDLRGELPEGYEVELYRNDILIDSTRRPVNGQYEFLQVPVDFGTNVFRFVFFGPQGQRHEEVRRISVGDGRRKPGELVYGFGVAQKDVNLLGVSGPFDSRPDDYGAWRASGSLEYGISTGLTAQLAGSWFQTATGGSSWLGTAGIRTGLGGTALRADIGIQKGGGKTAQLGIGGQLFGASYTVTHAEYSGSFIDEVRAFSSDFLDRASEVNLNATIRPGGEDSPFYIPVSLRARRLEFASGRRQTEATARASARFAGLQATKTIEYTSSRSPQGFVTNNLVGGFDLATLSGSRTQYRASLTYAAMPKLELRSAAVQVDHAFGRQTLASATLGHFFTTGETRLGLSASQRFERFTLGFSGDYAVPTGTYSAMLRLGIGFGRNPLTGRFFVDQPGLAAGGALALRAYHDRNADNRFDEGDLVLPEVEFGIGGKIAKTDKNGIAMAGRLGDGTRANYRIDMETLPDIALYPKSLGVSFVPRAGRVHVSDFAVVALSEIEGTARFVSDQGQKPVSGVQLELVGAEGKVARSTRTEGDGFYLFEQVAPGAYTIRIEPGQAVRLGIAMEGEGTVTTSPEGEVVRMDLAIQRPM